MTVHVSESDEEEDADDDAYGDDGEYYNVLLLASINLNIKHVIWKSSIANRFRTLSIASIGRTCIPHLRNKKNIFN